MAKPYHVSMAQHHAIQFVEQRMSALSNWCSQIFDFGETAWREYQSCECRKYFSYINGTKKFEGKNRLIVN